MVFICYLEVVAVFPFIEKRVPWRCVCARTLNRISYEDILHYERLSVSPSLPFLTTAKFGYKQQLNLEFFK